MSDIGAISSGRWHRTHDRLKIGATSFEYVTCRFGAAVCAPAGTGCKARPNKNAGRTHLPELKQPATFIVILLSIRLKPDSTRVASGVSRTCGFPTLNPALRRWHCQRRKRPKLPVFGPFFHC